MKSILFVVISSVFSAMAANANTTVNPSAPSVPSCQEFVAQGAKEIPGPSQMIVDLYVLTRCAMHNFSGFSEGSPINLEKTLGDVENGSFGESAQLMILRDLTQSVSQYYSVNLDRVYKSGNVTNRELELAGGNLGDLFIVIRDEIYSQRN